MIKTHSIYKALYANTDKNIILVTGGRGCEHPDTPIMMADLTIRKIKDIKVGDKVMGDDGTARTVLRTMSGRSQMFHVHQSNAEDYIVNDIHKLVIKKGKCAFTHHKGKLRDNFAKYADVEEMPITEFVNKSKSFRTRFFGYKVDSIPYPEHPIRIEPYFLGIWLGDGTSIRTDITSPEPEIRSYIYEYAERLGLRVSEIVQRGCVCYKIVRKGISGANMLKDLLASYDLIHNKHIPQEYISNSEQVRLELLAGLLDTDGSYDKNHYEITQKDKGIAESIKFIADTLGFRTSINKKSARIGEKDCGEVYRVQIGGDLWRIPCRVERKKAKENQKPRDWHLSRLEVTPLGEGDWCGITVDGNHRYLAKDGTVKRNSGKSFSVSTFIERLTFELGKNADGTNKPHVILYTRYTMTSAAVSVIPEFLEKIELDGTKEFFTDTKTDITNNITGARILFRGIKSSSGNQTAKLKSINGLTTFICDEAEEFVDVNSYETIMLSIRQKGIRNRVIIIMNPSDANHFVYQKYIKDTHKTVDYDGTKVQISTHPNVLHIHTSYLDNTEHLSDEFLAEAKYCKDHDRKRYDHIFMGQWIDQAEGAIITNWEYIDEMPEGLSKEATGQDFGFTNDPSAIIRCGVIGNNLYVDEECYKSGMLSSDLIAEHKRIGLPCYSESADPRLVREIALGGVLIYPVMKGGGSIMAGIDRMKAFEHIYVTKRSKNIAYEFNNWTWDKDMDGNFINRPIDANNHACDAIRYYVLGKILGKVMQPKKVSQAAINNLF